MAPLGFRRFCCLAFALGSSVLFTRYMQEDCNSRCKASAALVWLISLVVVTACIWYYGIDGAADNRPSAEPLQQTRLPVTDIQVCADDAVHTTTVNPSLVLETLPNNHISASKRERLIQRSKIPIQIKDGTALNPIPSIPSDSEIEDGILRLNKSGVVRKQNIRLIDRNPRLEKPNFYHPQCAINSEDRVKLHPPIYYYLRDAVQTEESGLFSDDDNESQ